jgi:hypothetical protein
MTTPEPLAPTPLTKRWLRINQHAYLATFAGVVQYYSCHTSYKDFVMSHNILLPSQPDHRPIVTNLPAKTWRFDKMHVRKAAGTFERSITGTLVCRIFVAVPNWASDLLNAPPGSDRPPWSNLRANFSPRPPRQTKRTIPRRWPANCGASTRHGFAA